LIIQSFLIKSLDCCIALQHLLL